jgi:uncharacterized protein with PIN domain
VIELEEQAVFIRFYEELNDFLPADKKKTEFRACFPAGATVKFLIEELGVPHTEVDLVLVNGISKGFSYRLEDSDRISVYPVFESFDIASVSEVRSSPLRITRFVLDVHLGKLARSLRILGFDALYSNGYDDTTIASIARDEARIILTRDRGLLKRKIVTHGYLVRSKNPGEQLAEVLGRFDFVRSIAPYSRCIVCNVLLEGISKAEVEGRVPAKVFQKYDEFVACPSCITIYWRGSHWEEMRKRFLQRIFTG